MARRATTPAKSDMPRAEGTASGGLSEAVGHDEHLIAFRMAGESFGFRLGDVGEIVRVPALAHMPFGPKSLLGLANLRGMVFPVVDASRLLGFPDTPLNEATRVIVIDRGAPVAFVVAGIQGLLTLPSERIETDDAGAGSIDPDLLEGIVKGAEGEGTIKILNPRRLLRDEFSRLGMTGPRSGPQVSVSASASSAATPDQQRVSLVSFDLGHQEYALPLERVREILPLPEDVSEVPRPETAVLGVVTLRDRLLPLVSLRALLGMPSETGRTERSKVVVLSLGNGVMGLVVDRTREILRVEAAAIDPAPALLTRGAGDAEIASICRLEQGRRLVALLSPDRLFRSELVSRILAEQGDAADEQVSQTDGSSMADEQFVIFRLADQEYGLPIGSVDEIARPPDQITRLPKAPAFIDGVINLRGMVIPIVDLRRRFELAAPESVSTQRILVLAIAGRKTGFMVDHVSEVMKVPVDAIRPAPEVSPEQMRLIGRVANLDAQGRMILLIDPAQLLNRVEADLLAKFDRTDVERTQKTS